MSSPPSAARQPVPSGAEPTGARPATVVAADDNTTNLFIMQKLLEKTGARVVVARDGREALSAVKACHPALVLLDISMPEMDGVEAARQIRAHFGERSPVIVAVTATDTFELRDACTAAGFDDFIAKPITSRTFLAQVEDYLRQRGGPPAS